MPIKLMPLPYPEDALEPAISAETLKVHHGKHHKAYVAKTNELIEGTSLAGKPLEDIVAAARDGGDEKLFNQAAQAWNHGFYWASLSPDKSSPSDDLAAAIDAQYGSVAKLGEEWVKKGAAQFGSGWAWLLLRGDKLSIETTGNADHPEGADHIPLAVIDVWEHAYYLDRHSEREAYLKAALRLMNWEFASANLASGKLWTYPG